MNYYDTLERPIVAAAHRVLPYRFQRGLATAAAAATYLADVGGIRRDLSHYVRMVFPDLGRVRAEWLGMRINIAKFRYFVDLALLMHGRERAVRERVAGRVVIENGERFQAARDKGRGVFLVSAHFACFYYMLFAEAGDVRGATLVRRFDSPGRQALFRRLSALTGRQIDSIRFGGTAALKILRRLRAGETVACMFDYFYEDTALVVSDFLGRPAASAAGVAAVAAHSGAVLLPVVCFHRGEDFVIRFEEEVEIGGGGEAETIYEVSRRLNDVVGDWVRQWPEQWLFWRSLGRRWHFAEQALAAPEGLEAADAA